mmetsp:Transcript_23446/g.54633  ORF Transcript_23446/g.54633 Transcript_23446/m.54633 type:complete len:200 (+) Transcript_23446:107-706(+)
MSSCKVVKPLFPFPTPWGLCPPLTTPFAFSPCWCPLCPPSTMPPRSSWDVMILLWSKLGWTSSLWLSCCFSESCPGNGDNVSSSAVMLLRRARLWSVFIRTLTLFPPTPTWRTSFVARWLWTLPAVCFEPRPQHQKKLLMATKRPVTQKIPAKSSMVRDSVSSSSFSHLKGGNMSALWRLESSWYRPWMSFSFVIQENA